MGGGRGRSRVQQRPLCVRTRIGRAVGQRQVGASPPGPRAEAPLALAAVGACGVVFTLALQAALAHGAQVGVQVALAPGGTRRGQGVSERVGGLFQLSGGAWRVAWKGLLRPSVQPATTLLRDKYSRIQHSESFPSMRCPWLLPLGEGGGGRDEMPLSQVLNF